MGFGFKITGGLFVGVWSAIFATAGVAGQCDSGTVHLSGDWGQARFSVEVADDAAERARGLMHRESMPASAGMLFIYPNPQHVGFWMQNTLIPLDMLFIDETGQVVRIHENAIPLDTTVIDGGPNIFSVLEINGGMAGSLGISAGSRVQHPSFPQEISIWPCEVE